MGLSEIAVAPEVRIRVDFVGGKIPSGNDVAVPHGHRLAQLAVVALLQERQQLRGGGRGGGGDLYRQPLAQLPGGGGGVVLAARFVDAPGGGGKIPLMPDYVAGRETDDDRVLFQLAYGF